MTREAMETFVRVMRLADAYAEKFEMTPNEGRCTFSVRHQRGLGLTDLPELTAQDVLALNVLLGDPATLPKALADFMIDQGHEYAVECYEKGKADERERVRLSIRNAVNLGRGELVTLPEGWTVNGPNGMVYLRPDPPTTDPEG